METPTDLVGTSDDVLLLEFASDAERRLSTEDSLLLVDIYLQGKETDDVQWFRRVVWGRRLMSHQDILHLLCAGELCSDIGRRCHLFHNSVVWPSDDAARRALISGDYIKLRIRSLDDSSSCLLMEQVRDQENAEANRFLFRASPLSEWPGDSDDDKEVTAEQSEEEPSDRTSRSRSRKSESDENPDRSESVSASSTKGVDLDYRWTITTTGHDKHPDWKKNPNRGDDSSSQDSTFMFGSRFESGCEGKAPCHWPLVCWPGSSGFQAPNWTYEGSDTKGWWLWHLWNELELSWHHSSFWTVWCQLHPTMLPL